MGSRRRVWGIASLLALMSLVISANAESPPVSGSGHPGGLVVFVGAPPLSQLERLSATGRYVIQVLVAREQVTPLRRQLLGAGIHGVVSVVEWRAGRALPYTENLVNVAVVRGEPEAAAELKRVVQPLGGIFVEADSALGKTLLDQGLEPDTRVPTGDSWKFFRKPWPAEMDTWSHPRHGADGNAVSGDRLVGPPRRIRWVAGPWQEVANLVSQGGVNYYGGILARNGFNGLRLWDARLKPSPSRGGFGFAGGGPVPVSGDGRVFVFSDGRLQAIDGVTGKTVVEFAETEMPGILLYDDGLLVAVFKRRLCAYRGSDGGRIWQADAELPHDVVVGDGMVAYVQGDFRRGHPTTIVVRDLESGDVRWEKGQLPWADNVTRCVYHDGVLAFEISTLNDDGPGNALHLLSVADGESVYASPVLPGMNHKRQARAMFIGGKLWLLHGGKDASKKRLPVQVSAIDIGSGKVEVTFVAGLAHCFPPVATPRYLFSGELDLTDLRTGVVDANRITKAACSRDFGWVPANGLIYVTPKHCVCWPMLRGYCALAAERPGGNPATKPVEQLEFPFEKGVDPPADRPSSAADDWPIYRYDAWRSSATPAAGPVDPRVRWSIDLAPASLADGPIATDQHENPFVKGPVTAPVIAGGRIYVARPDAHQVLSLDAETGRVRWSFVAEGRVDTPPTVHAGLCLFGSKLGWVYCLRADDGQLVWRRRVAPLEENIVAYGQVESPWPVPGSVLVSEGVAYFAAGRQSLADGGILLFAVDPISGEMLWTTRLDTVPQKGFYRSSGHEFDNFDLLFREGNGVAMSRWVFDGKTGEMSVDPWKAFSRLQNGDKAAMVPQGCWSYAPRNQRRANNHYPKRPLVVFRSNELIGLSQDRRILYRRDFDLEGGEEFRQKWITGWENSNNSRKGKEAWRADRLMQKTEWKVELFSKKEKGVAVNALVRAGERIYLVSSDGRLQVRKVNDGSLLASVRVPAPLWDGLAVAGGNIYLTTASGRLLCLGDPIAD